MYKLEAILKNNAGLHARPATLFIKEASKYNSKIKVVKKDKEYNSKSIVGILSMGAVKGDNITIIAEGDDEKEAVKALKNLVDNNFGE